jgi:hypothetical protein
VFGVFVEAERRGVRVIVEGTEGALADMGAEAELLHELGQREPLTQLFNVIEHRL